MNEHPYTGSSDPASFSSEYDSPNRSQSSDSQSSDSGGSDATEGSAFGAGVGGGAPKSKARSRKRVSRRKTSSRRSKAGEEGSSATSEDAAEASSLDQAGDPVGGADQAESKPARKRKARSKKSTTKKSTAKKASRGESDADDDRDGSDRDGGRGSESDLESGPEDSGGAKKRRRRGSRGGRRRKKDASDDASSERAGREDDSKQKPKSGRRRNSRASRDGAAVDIIPGEDDELPAEAPAKRSKARSKASKKKRTRGRSKDSEGGDDYEDGESARSSKKKRKRSSKKAAEPELSEEEQLAAAEALRTDVIYINACEPEEKRVGVVGDDGRIHDLLMTAESQKTLVNDIYRGRVVNLEPAIGAAFVDFGQGRNGFLHTSDVLPMYGEDGFSLDSLLTASVDPDDWDSSDGESSGGRGGDSEDEEGDPEAEGAHEEGHRDWHDHDHDENDDDDDSESKGGKGSRGRSRGKKKTRSKPAKARGKAASSGKDAGRGSSRRRARLPISELLKVGDQVVVQITKDAIGDKGPTLTTYISIPGRYLVLMPSMARTGVSRKIPDDKERRRLKRILASLNAPTEMGVIVRTAGVGKTKTDLQRDLDYLLGVWETFGKRLKAGRGPAALYQESDVAIRTLRDLFNKTTKKVVVDDPGVLEQLDEFAAKLMPEHSERIQRYAGDRPIFHDAGLEQDFEKIFARRVELASGGSIVFDQAEALVAIDVNSGRTRTDSYDFEEVALKTNMEAVPEIARQIRLRDLGGIIVCDFIDMMKSSSNRAVERALRQELAPDRARSKLGRISQFGLLELTRQRLGPGTHKKVFQTCPRCRGTARIRTVESRAQAILRRLGSALTQKGFSKVEVRAHPEVVEYLKESLWDYVRALEHRFDKELSLTAVPEQPEDSVLRYLRADGREVRPGGRRKR